MQLGRTQESPSVLLGGDKGQSVRSQRQLELAGQMAVEEAAMEVKSIRGQRI